MLFTTASISTLGFFDPAIYFSLDFAGSKPPQFFHSPFLGKLPTSPASGTWSRRVVFNTSKSCTDIFSSWAHFQNQTIFVTIKTWNLPTDLIYLPFLKSVWWSPTSRNFLDELFGIAARVLVHFRTGFLLVSQVVSESFSGKRFAKHLENLVLEIPLQVLRLKQSELCSANWTKASKIKKCKFTQKTTKQWFICLLINHHPSDFVTKQGKYSLESPLNVHLLPVNFHLCHSSSFLSSKKLTRNFGKMCLVDFERSSVSFHSPPDLRWSAHSTSLALPRTGTPTNTFRRKMEEIWWTNWKELPVIQTSNFFCKFQRSSKTSRAKQPILTGDQQVQQLHPTPPCSDGALPPKTNSC